MQRILVGCLLLWGFGVLLFMAPTAHAKATHSTVQDPILAGHEAFLNRDIPALESLVLKNEHLLLSDYLQFWLLEARLGTALRLVPAEDYHRFMNHGEGPLQEQLQTDWLKALVQAQDWKTLQTELPNYTGGEPEILCGLALARGGQLDAELQASLKQLWLMGKPLTPTCEGFFVRWIADGRLSGDEIFLRYSAALSQENLPLARATAHFLFAQEGPVREEAFNQVTRDPAAWIAQLRGNPNRGERALTLYALVQVASVDLPKAVLLWEGLPSEFAQSARSKGWARIGTQAALQLDPYALTAYRKVRDTVPDADLEWWVRAALRLGAWDDVLLATSAMSEQEQAGSTWKYWRARALQRLGKKEEAELIFKSMSQDPDFYGQLAADELGLPVTLPPPQTPMADDLVEVQKSLPVQRALALAKLGLQKEAVREWTFATQGMREDQLLAAAELARKAGWYERMIASGERAGAKTDASFRYPLPFREAVKAHASHYKLDEAWVYGLMRQESRFLSDARSRTGAMGLMQLMPSTARWVAQKLGIKDFKASSAEDVETNIKLGSYYLRHILDHLGHPVLATAGYNAGPSRVRKWLDTKPLEGAIFCETIPVTETRDYVKKVMANANVYTARLGRPPRSLKARLGTIQSVGSLQSPDLEDVLSLDPTPHRVGASVASKD